MNTWLVGVLLLAGIVLGVVGAILSGRARVPRWARLLIVLAVILLVTFALGDFIGSFLGYSTIYSSVRDTGYFQNRYVTKMAALIMAALLYVALGFASHFFLHFKWKKAVGCVAVWFFIYNGTMAILTNGQIFSPQGNERVYVRLPATEQYPKGEIRLIDKEMKQDIHYGVEAKKPDPEIMKEYYDQHPDERPGGTVMKQTAPPPLPPQSSQPTKEAGNLSPASSFSASQSAGKDTQGIAWTGKWQRLGMTMFSKEILPHWIFWMIVAVVVVILIPLIIWRNLHSDEPLLVDEGTLDIPATTTPFIAHEHFAVNTKRSSPVKIREMNDNFKSWFLPKIEEPSTASSLSYRKLTRSAHVDQILLSLLHEGNVETTLTELYFLMRGDGLEEDNPFEHASMSVLFIKDSENLLREIYLFNLRNTWTILAYPLPIDDKLERNRFVISRSD